jgi:hypothetical protein
LCVITKALELFTPTATHLAAKSNSLSHSVKTPSARRVRLVFIIFVLFELFLVKHLYPGCKSTTMSEPSCDSDPVEPYNGMVKCETNVDAYHNYDALTLHST